MTYAHRRIRIKKQRQLPFPLVPIPPLPPPSMAHPLLSSASPAFHLAAAPGNGFPRLSATSARPIVARGNRGAASIFPFRFRFFIFFPPDIHHMESLVVKRGHEEREAEVPKRAVRAGRKGRRRRAGRVAEPRRDAGLRRGSRGGAHHRQRRASG